MAKIIEKLASTDKKSPKATPKVTGKTVSAAAATMKMDNNQINTLNNRLTKTFSTGLTDQLITECKDKLLAIKGDLLNRVKETRGKLDQFETGGDEADQTMRILAEQEMLNLTDRLRSQLLEIESALARIENGTFGYCEETEEMIETDRLRAIPWTRLSIEGAEIRESMGKRYAR